jgi:LEA14-like dessication related protein
MTVIIRNLSNIGFDIDSYNFDVYLNNILVSNISESIKQTLVPKGLSEISLRVSFNPTKINVGTALELVSALMFKKNTTTIRIKGHVSGSIAYIPFTNMPIDVTSTIEEILADDPNAQECSV